jgi:hypothetical protein
MFDSWSNFRCQHDIIAEVATKAQKFGIMTVVVASTMVHDQPRVAAKRSANQEERRRLPLELGSLAFALPLAMALDFPKHGLA